LVAENAAPAVTNKFSTLNGNTHIFLSGGAMEIEYRNDFFRRDTAMLIHHLDDPGDDSNSLTV
jgi:hypothetical protein